MEYLCNFSRNNLGIMIILVYHVYIFELRCRVNEPIGICRSELIKCVEISGTNYIRYVETRILRYTERSRKSYLFQ